MLLSTEAAAAQRLTRARQKIAAAHIPYRMPTEAELPGRLPAVCGVIHSLYTASHAPIDGPAAYDVKAGRDAVRLGELLHRLLPDRPMPAALLALMLLTEARRPARLDEHDELVPLDRQDRSRWDSAMITRGIELLNGSLKRTDATADPYQLQAAIAAEHARSTAYDTTDWTEITRLYRLLVSIVPSDAARLGLVVATAESDGALAGLAVLDRLTRTTRWHAVRAELLARERDTPRQLTSWPGRSTAR